MLKNSIKSQTLIIAINKKNKFVIKLLINKCCELNYLNSEQKNIVKLIKDNKDPFIKKK